jgi:hypothetical protein
VHAAGRIDRDADRVEELPVRPKPGRVTGRSGRGVAHILVVDDDLTLIERLRVTWQHAYQVQFCATGVEPLPR